ncbi:MAG TPA: transglycosylase domain-containing protein, partial [bacterium]|nr:transglycosylase domain-containing protein [bacterium]
MKYIKWIFLGMIAALAGAGSGCFLGGYLYYASQLPELNAALDYRPALITHIYDRNGEVLAELAAERRFPVPLSAVNEWMQEAIIAIEDQNFYSHRGLDLEGIV